MMILKDGMKMTKTKTFELFPVKVCEFDFSDKPYLQDVLDIIHEEIELEEVNEHFLLEGEECESSYSNEKTRPEIFDHPDMSEMKNDVLECLDTMAREIRSPRTTQILDSWFNVMRGESSVKPHVHEKSFISGAFYVKLPEGSSKLYFNNPQAKVGNKLYGSRILPEQFEMPIKENHLYLFPSWLEHGTTSSTNEERIVISFNT